MRPLLMIPVRAPMCSRCLKKSHGSIRLKQDGTLAADERRRQLAIARCAHVTQALSPRDFCFRGGLIDLIPMDSVLPYRIELFGNQIESIRSFDVGTQRSIHNVNEVRLLPTLPPVASALRMVSVARHVQFSFGAESLKHHPD